MVPNRPQHELALVPHVDRDEQALGLSRAEKGERFICVDAVDDGLRGGQRKMRNDREVLKVDLSERLKENQT
jgi:hypothetical protein